GGGGVEADVGAGGFDGDGWRIFLRGPRDGAGLEGGDAGGCERGAGRGGFAEGGDGAAVGGGRAGGDVCAGGGDVSGAGSAGAAGDSTGEVSGGGVVRGGRGRDDAGAQSV